MIRLTEIAIVSGASHGIGKAIAKTLLIDDGFTIINASISTGVDVTNELAVINLVNKTLEKYGRIDVLVNNAGYSHHKSPFYEVTTKELEESFEVNVYGAFYLMREVVLIMLKQRHGTIVNIASLAALDPSKNFGIYSASKAALVALTKVAAKEFGNKIFCVAVCPGATNTKMWKAHHSESVPQDSDAVARVVSEIIRNRTAGGLIVHTGDCVTVVDGQVAVV